MHKICNQDILEFRKARSQWQNKQVVDHKRKHIINKPLILIRQDVGNYIPIILSLWTSWPRFCNAFNYQLIQIFSALQKVYEKIVSKVKLCLHIGIHLNNQNSITKMMLCHFHMKYSAYVYGCLILHKKNIRHFVIRQIF